ncbi:restriction endonuclease subunit S [Streptococcus infantarius]|uniref:restriction endonuclease subunit S n=1 Tax=Streptococcus infantarius TaxID=102684 RepID=UPI0022E6B98C|nr:restriction endonuclease subunit S [Streptococcus infantarius]
MSEWKNCTLGDLGEVVGGGTPSTKKPEYYGGDIAWITPKDLSTFSGRFIKHGERNITEEGLKGSSARLMPKKTILFSSRAPIGYVAIAENEVSTNQGFKSIVPNDDTDYLFLYYLLKFNKDKIENMGSGTTFKEVSGKTVKAIDVTVPSNKEKQHEIAKILGSLDDKIENNRKINHHLEQIARSIFKSWFVDFNPFGGDVPASWNEELLFDLATVTYGKNLPTKKLLSSGYRVFGGNGQIGYYSEYLYKKERILISCRGAASGTVRLSRPYSFVTNNSLIVNEKEPELFAYLKEWSLNRQFFDAVTGSAQPQVTVDSLKLISLPKPDKETLEKFTNLLMPIYNEIEANTTECEKLVILRDTLLPKLMTGEISVTD